MTRRSAFHPQPPPPSQPATRERPEPSLAFLPLDDRRCPRREIAVLCETDSGHRWDGA
ncbi:hypothetical protein JJL56_13415 [Azospirillum sp. YIM DDC1]|uniref:Uncharacterized protein n=1 Tax=Azospirillum aestuarii TaxID=2802052 RepID=A0ABS1HZN8_9PROT|nr:hypothetical protein [Azospirillum aestuarii]MBK4719873.1 hypothetical protein [Azospirillum aestuarii]